MKLQEQTALNLANKNNRFSIHIIPYTVSESKRIDAQSGIYTDKDHKITYIPAFDVNGVLWTMQTIQEDGSKRFAKNSKKEGCFHVLGGFDALNHAPALLIGEGYATSEIVRKATGLPTVCAFDAGNLKKVAQVLRQKYPDKPIFIMGDDDKIVS